MKRAFFLGALAALVSVAFAACTMDFDQFQAGTGGAGGAGGDDRCGGECCNATQCERPANGCMVAACVDATCGEVPEANGTELPTQVVGDCKTMVCQAGAAQDVDDPGDPLGDNNACTIEACDPDGSTQTTPADPGTACTGGVCNGMGDCVECLMDADCPQNAPSCDTGSNVCVPASCMDGDENGTETDIDCGGDVCAPCGVGEDCEVASDCTSGVCGGDGQCDPPQCDDGIENGNETDLDCGGFCLGCGPGEGCDEDGDCQGDDCTGVGGTCVPNCDDNAINNDETDEDCGGGTCTPCDVGEMCAGNDANCLSGNCGANDLCELAPLGAPCTQDGQCASDQCVEGVCCTTSCNGECEECDLAGSVGTCTDIPSGQDPDMECSGPAVCDGQGACKQVQGQSCTDDSDCLMGSCADDVCCDAACDAECEACDLGGSVGTCTGHPAGTDPEGDCTGQETCDGMGACSLLADGLPCVLDNECDSAECTDGVCCDDACGGTCEACDLVGSVGTCTNVPNGQDPDNECAAATPNCNGTGMCGP